MRFSCAWSATSRRSSTLALLGLAAAAAPAVAQRTTVANTDAVRVAVVTFSRTDRDSAMAVAVPSAIRDRLSVAFAQRFTTAPKRVIDTNLVISGFPVDMPLDAGQWRQLARVLNSRLLVEGNILPLGDDSVEIVARLSEVTGALPQTASASVRIERRRVNAGTGSSLANQLAEVYRSFADTRECAARRQAREFPRALEAARLALTRYPLSSQAFLCMAQVMQAQNAPADTVLRLLERARDSDSLNVLAQWQIARVAEERHDTTELIHSLRHILVADAANSDVRISLARLLNNRSFTDSAIAVLDSALERNPNLVEILLAKSVVEASAGRWAPAGADLARAAEIDTARVDSAFVVRITGIYTQAGDTTNLIRWVRTATERFPTQPNYFYLLAALLRARADTAGAFAAINDYLRLRPDDGLGHVVVASLFIDMGQPDSAVTHATIAGQADSLQRGYAARILYAAGVGRLRLQPPDLAGAADLLGRAKDWWPGAVAPALSYYLGLSQLQLAAAADNEAVAASGRDQTQAKCDAARREGSLLDQAEANVTAGGRTNPDQANNFLTQVIPAYRGRVAAFLRQARCPTQ